MAMKKKGYRNGGKVKKMMKGGVTGGMKKPRRMMKGGAAGGMKKPRRMMKGGAAGGMKRPRMMQKGGAAGGKMTVAQLRAAAKKMGYKVTKEAPKKKK